MNPEEYASDNNPGTTMNFGARLKQIRTDKNLTQPQLAELIGIEQSYLSKLENDKSQPSAEMFGNIIKALGMAPESFLAELDPPTQAALGHIPEVSQFREGIKARRVHHARRYIFGAAAAAALGFALMLAANDGIFFPKYQYKYVSKGVILAGEGENIFEQYRMIQGMRMAARSISPEEMSRLTAEFESNRVRHLTVESWRDRGSVYFENAEGGRRVFELVDKRYVQSDYNRLLQYLGALLAFCGPLALVVEWRLRVAAQHITRNPHP